MIIMTSKWLFHLSTFYFINNLDKEQPFIRGELSYDLTIPFTEVIQQNRGHIMMYLLVK
jgi:hypothetical protein